MSIILCSVVSLQVPLSKLESCRSAAQIERIVRALPTPKSVAEQRFFLWANILLDADLPSGQLQKRDLFERAHMVALEPTKDKGLRALQAWWSTTVAGRNYVPPRRLSIASWGTITDVRGRKQRVPVYQDRERDAEVDRWTQTNGVLRSDQTRDDALITYRWWGLVKTARVSDAEIAWVAAQAQSPFRVPAVAELARREAAAKRLGPYSRQWQAIALKRKGTVLVDVLLAWPNARVKMINRRPLPDGPILPETYKRWSEGNAQ